MDITGKTLWICGGTSAAALVCCIALGLTVRSQGQLIDRLQADARAVDVVRDADAESQTVAEGAKRKADEDAQKKAAIVDGVSADLDNPDFVRGLQRGLRGENANSGADPAGKLDGSVRGTDHAAGTDANVGH